MRVPYPRTSPPPAPSSGEDDVVTAAFPGWVTGSSALHHSCSLCFPSSDTPLRDWVATVAICAGAVGRRGPGSGRLAGGCPSLGTHGLLEVPAGAEQKAGRTGCWGGKWPCGGPWKMTSEPPTPAIWPGQNSGVTCREKPKERPPGLAGKCHTHILSQHFTVYSVKPGKQAFSCSGGSGSWGRWSRLCHQADPFPMPSGSKLAGTTPASSLSLAPVEKSRPHHSCIFLAGAAFTGSRAGSLTRLP